MATTSDGVRIAFDAAGSGPAIVLVHGLGDDRELWRPIVDRLQHRYTCVLLDLRGHGESGAAADYDPFGLDRDIVAVVEHLQLRLPLVIGHSLGGFAATLYASRHAARAVINVEQPLSFGALAATVRSLAPAIAQGRVADVLWSVLDAIGVGELPEAVLERLRTTRARLSRDALLGLWRPLLEDAPETLSASVDGILAGITAPYFALLGAAAAAGYADWLRARVPGATFEVWEGLGHFLHLADVQRFASFVLRLEASP